MGCAAFTAASAAATDFIERRTTNYAALAHDEEAIGAIEAGASGAFVELRDEEAAE